MRTLLLALALCAGCPYKPVPTKPPKYKACSKETYANPSGICKNVFTDEHIQCANCVGDSSCVTSTPLYCVRSGAIDNPCYSDPVCKLAQ